MRLLVTGGAGRLGIDVCNALLKNDFQVSIFDLDTVSTRRSLKRLIGPADIITGDITRPDLVGPALRNVDAVLHMDALLTINTASNREIAEQVNVGGTRNVVEAIKNEERTVPLIYTSSVAVFRLSRTDGLVRYRQIPGPPSVPAENIQRLSPGLSQGACPTVHTLLPTPHALHNRTRIWQAHCQAHLIEFNAEQ